ncbi:hypothetical protein PSQ40_05195 [Curvibacter sp. HBC61]|uniref:ABC transporter substrate-binding protein n=1 Tax=Curvibacter cyanobacteriorum TaxID=3026422 RepID=A0ABT5MV85_9BURK|nr:hypothetical protein [Curvibacter sp. HBC61]MDD0837963.1 hypothetical protein [Curvibacter sp. HBC61]
MTPDPSLGAARWTRPLLLGALVLLAGCLLWQGSRRPAVLVVHSQSEGLPWTQGVNAGLDAVLATRKDVRLQRLYLNAHATEQLDGRVRTAHGFIRRWQPDALVTVDDVAQSTVGVHYLGQPSPWLVYSGIEDAERSLAASGAPNVSGIGERTPWSVVERTLLHLAEPKGAGGASGLGPQAQRKRWRVALINDGGAASTEEAQGFIQHPWSLAKPVGVWRCHSPAQWAAALREIAHRADLVVVGDYRAMPPPADAPALTWSRDLVTQALAELSQPMVALSYYAVRDGVPVGVLPSPMEQGAVAARHALQAFSVRAGAIEPSPRHAQTTEFALVINPESLAQRRLTVGGVEAHYARLSSRLLRSSPP